MMFLSHALSHIRKSTKDIRNKRMPKACAFFKFKTKGTFSGSISLKRKSQGNKLSKREENNAKFGKGFVNVNDIREEWRRRAKNVNMRSNIVIVGSIKM